MNYRHAYHAGNFTEVFKHAALVALVNHLQIKPKPIVVIDTHAGLGLYDLASPEALKTGEAASGVLAVLDRLAGHASEYASRVRPFVAAGMYPGSPALVAGMLRPGDRLVACELHPADAAVLRQNFVSDHRVAVHQRDGYEGMIALVPPPERRGLVFVDPPYEERDEVGRLGRRLAAAIRKWPTGTFMVWYPVKRRGVREALVADLLDSHAPDCLCAEFLRYEPDGARLAGSGLVLVNAPWRFDETLQGISANLVEAFGGGTSAKVDWARRPI